MTPTPKPTAYQNFADLARRILTTPKADLLKHAPKPAPKSRPKKPK